MNISHIYRGNSDCFTEKRLIFEGAAPSPAPAPEPKENEAPPQGGQEDFAQKMARIQEEGMRELDAATQRAEAQKQAGERPAGPQPKVEIGEITYASAEGVQKTTPAGEPVKKPATMTDKQAEQLLAEVEAEQAKTMAALEASGSSVAPESASVDTAALDRAAAEASKHKPTLLESWFGRKEKDKS